MVLAPARGAAQQRADRLGAAPRRACRASVPPASRSEASVRAEMTSGGSSVSAAAALRRRGAMRGGAVPSTAWPLVPPKPNELTPAQRPVRDRFDLAHEPQIEFVERDLRVRRLAMQRRRHHAAFERQRRLDQPGHAGGRFEMADIGLDRADRQRLAPALAEGAPDRGGLDRVAGRRAGAVHLEKREVVGGDAGALAYGADQRALRRFARQRQADRAAVGVDAGAEDHGAHAVAVGERLRQRLQDDDAAAFAAHIAVGALVEGEAAAAARQHRGAAEAEKRIGREQQVDAADDRASRCGRRVSPRRRGAARPATTSRPYRSSGSARAGRRRRRSGWRGCSASRRS